jgi:hypothetical protein
MLLSLLSSLVLTASAEGELAQRSLPPLVTAEGERLSDEGKRVTDMPFIAVTIDAGLPDGIGASLVVMPVSFLRIHLGGLTNGLGAGVRVGATVLAFPTWPVRPLLNVEGGYVFGGYAPWALDSVTDPTLKAVLDHANIGFASAHLGLELGSRNIAFVLRGGISWIDVDLGGQSIDLGGGVKVTSQSTTVRGFIPSARLGFMVSFG